jgi:hypothetical protein
VKSKTWGAERGDADGAAAGEGGHGYDDDDECQKEGLQRV